MAAAQRALGKQPTRGLGCFVLSQSWEHRMVMMVIPLAGAQEQGSSCANCRNTHRTTFLPRLQYRWKPKQNQKSRNNCCASTAGRALVRNQFVTSRQTRGPQAARGCDLFRPLVRNQQTTVVAIVASKSDTMDATITWHNKSREAAAVCLRKPLLSPELGWLITRCKLPTGTGATQGCS